MALGIASLPPFTSAPPSTTASSNYMQLMARIHKLEAQNQALATQNEAIMREVAIMRHDAESTRRRLVLAEGQIDKRLAAQNPGDMRSIESVRLLTRRELDAVHRLLVTGECNKVIAAFMETSLQVLKNHFRYAYVKLGVHSRAELLALASRRPEFYAAVDAAMGDV